MISKLSLNETRRLRVLTLYVCRSDEHAMQPAWL
jgi:hypothetical protein